MKTYVLSQSLTHDDEIFFRMIQMPPNYCNCDNKEIKEALFNPNHPGVAIWQHRKNALKQMKYV